MKIIAILAIYGLIYILACAYSKYRNDNFK